MQKCILKIFLHYTFDPLAPVFLRAPIFHKKKVLNLLNEKQYVDRAVKKHPYQAKVNGLIKVEFGPDTTDQTRAQPNWANEFPDQTGPDTHFLFLKC